MNKHALNHSVKADLYLMACVFVAGAMAVGMMLSGDAFTITNMLYLGATMLLLMCSYFFGIVLGMGMNLVFVFCQALYMVYVYLTAGNVDFIMVFWLFAPFFLNVTFYGMTQQLRTLQADNADLRDAMVEHGAFDEQTNLRTTVSFLEDSAVFIETSRRFDIPATVIVIRIRYYSDLESMLGTKRIHELIHVVSATLKRATRDNDITYILNNENPTWGVLVFADEAGAKIAADRIREHFAQELAKSDTMRDVDLTLKIGIHMWPGNEDEGPEEFMAAGIKELEYDV